MSEQIDKSGWVLLVVTWVLVLGMACSMMYGLR